MKLCSKCKIEKDDNQYQKYWHSTQNKFRIRGYCISCFYEQKRIYRESIKERKLIQPVTPELESDIVNRQCCDCNEVKELNENNFRKNAGEKRYYSNRCIECQKYIDKIDAQCRRDEKKIEKLKLIQSIQIEKIIQPVEDLTPPVPIPTPSLVTEEYKTCNTCFELKPISDYYKRAKVKTYNRCKVCELAKEKAERLEYMDENSGSERVPLKPNTYNDEFQKRDTFLMLEALGYTFNEEKGIWYKEPWKTKDGKFLLLKKYDRLSNVGMRPGMKPISTEKIKKIYDLFDKGYTRKYIAAELEITKTTVCKYLNKKIYG